MVKKGARLGLKTGFWLAVAYSFLIYAGAILTSLSSSLASSTSVYWSAVMMVFFLLFGGLVCGLAGGIAGSIVGAIIAYDLAHARSKISEREAFLVGVGIAGSAACLCNLLWLKEAFGYFSTRVPFWTFSGIPGLICLVAGGWLALRLNQSLVAATPKPGFPGTDDWLVRYISRSRQSYSRYHLDMKLIGAGHDPLQVEAAWKSVDQIPPSVPTIKTTYASLWSLKFWLVALAAFYLALWLFGSFMICPVLLLGPVAFFYLKNRRHGTAALSISLALALYALGMLLNYTGFAFILLVF